MIMSMSKLHRIMAFVLSTGFDYQATMPAHFSA